LAEVYGAEAPPELAGQILGQLFDKRFPVLCSLLALLFKFHDAITDLPIGGSHQRIHAPGRSGASGLKQRYNVVTDFAVQ
jgi:hypothetical protein